MADEGMSIVPYGSGNLDVVLRHNDSVVVFDRDSQQLVLRHAAESDDGNLELADCPYCHRPLRDSSSTQDDHHGGTQPEFINPHYFRMLHNSLPSSVSSSSPPSPRRRLVPPALADGPTSEPSYSGSGIHSTQGISSAAFTQDYFKKFFVEETVLGKGGKGVVLLVKHVLDGVSLGQYACKRVPVGDDHEWLEKVLAEVQLLQHLTHQNLVSYRHVWLENAKISTFGPSVPCAFILQQYCNAGDLHNYICGSVETPTTTEQLKERLRRKSRGGPEPPSEAGGLRKLNFEEIYSFFKDITSGLRYLHANGYIHRDLKPNNCLLHKTSDGIRVLVSDFGEVQAQDSMRRSTGATGTVSFCAPEVLRRDYPGGPFGNFTFKSDIFSLGMILYFLCFAQLPYTHADLIHEEKEDLDQLREEISHWAGFDDAQFIRPDLPGQLYTFLKRLLSLDPDGRPSADEVLSGLQAGANVNESFRSRRTSPTSPDIRPSARIHPVESTDSPTFRPSSSPNKSLTRSPVAVRRNPLYEPDGAEAASRPVVEETSPLSERNTSLSPENDMMVRPWFSSAQSHSPAQAEHREVSQEPPQPVQQLLPPPPGRFSLARVFPGAASLIDSQIPAVALQLAAFLLKVVSTFQPCSPLAVNPWVAYPLLLLAAVNFPAAGLWTQIVSLLLHLLISLCPLSGMAISPEAIELSEATHPGDDFEKLQQVPEDLVGDTTVLQNHETKPEAESEPDGAIYPHGVQFVLISLSLCFCVFLVGLDATILTTAVPRITDEFGSVADVGWYDAAFRLTSCMSQLSQGKLYDNYPVKWVFLVNLLLFEGGILLSGLAPSSFIFIIGRAITGLGFSGISQGCMVIIAISTPLRRRPTFVGLISASEYTAIAIAPILGGILTSDLSWRWCFYINLPAAALPSAVLLLLKLPTITPRGSKTHIQKLRELDLLGFFLFAPAVLCLLLALQWGGDTYSWTNGRIIALLVLSPIIFTGFCLLQHRKQDTAMLPPRVLRKRIIITGAAFSLCLSACRAIVQYYLSIWFQTVRNATPLQSGLNTLPLVISVLISAITGGWLISRTRTYTPILLPASLLVIAGIALMTTFTPTTPAKLWIPSLILLGLGSGSAVGVPFIAVQAILPMKDISIGMALMTFSQDIGEAVFISVAQAIFLNRLTGDLAENVPGLNPMMVTHLGATSLEGKLPGKYLDAVVGAYDVAIGKVAS
ncbi:MFS general substrate transporter [Aspergillus eucalypticola CBS 122712]|uniref:non-specific serine/threonine protein kinase n=1 Tax=Aspergillus eucalypticola (strain CBS 122712 / IBT 29274) TaxID=1448314 RepID=A0A317UY27_ASPEC|nr:MFS general substrate transporter [Aspergillus eucalypticola CBS 122712]PWY66953.1 MFS general substrate transporter [Aspergillus eucalypticola CBS 122712]